MRESEVLRRAGERHEKFAVSEAVFARWCEVAPRDQCHDAVASPAAACREPPVPPGKGEQRTLDARFDTDAPLVEDPEDRKSGESEKSVSVRVDPDGGRIINKKRNKTNRKCEQKEKR